MGFGLGCETKASKTYRNRMVWLMLVYVGVVFTATSIVRHEHPAGWQLYFWAVLPAIPLLFVLASLGIYLRDESDEYMRMVAMRSLLVATGALLATVVVSDFLRSLTPVGALPPFTGFILFFVSFGAAQAVQQLMNRGGSDD
jgi:hypothetical protein